MTAKVIPIGAARARRPEQETLRFSFDDNGALSIRPIRQDGIVVPAFVIPDERVDELLLRLHRERARIRNERCRVLLAEIEAAKQAARRPPPKHRDICRMRRDGGRKPIGGCRRNATHKGPCRDERGDFTPATCSHIGMGRTRIEVVATGETFYNCANCGHRA